MSAAANLFVGVIVQCPELVNPVTVTLSVVAAVVLSVATMTAALGPEIASRVQFTPSQRTVPLCVPPPVTVAPRMFVVESVTSPSVPSIPVQEGNWENGPGKSWTRRPKNPLRFAIVTPVPVVLGKNTLPGDAKVSANDGVVRNDPTQNHASCVLTRPALVIQVPEHL